jgi:hypothetical protein
MNYLKYIVKTQFICYLCEPSISNINLQKPGRNPISHSKEKKSVSSALCLPKVFCKLSERSKGETNHFEVSEM